MLEVHQWTLCLLRRSVRHFNLQNNYSRSRACNEGFFRNWSPSMAYWLGMLYADGCVKVATKRRLKGEYSVHLMLSCKDLHHTEKFRTALESTYISAHWKNGKSCVVGQNISNVVLAKDLIQLGCVPRKSLVLEWPEQLPEEYSNHFVRGYFDGDGCIHYNRSDKSFAVAFCGAQKFITELQAYLKCKVLFDSKTIGSSCNMGNIRQLIYKGSKSPMKVLEWMYKDSETAIRMDRKYMYYRKCLETKELNLVGRDLEMRKFLDGDEWAYQLQCKCMDTCPLIHSFDRASRIDPRTIVQLDKATGEVVQKWDNAKAIQLAKGYQTSNILSVCRGSVKSVYGFKWQFLDS